MGAAALCLWAMNVTAAMPDVPSATVVTVVDAGSLDAALRALPDPGLVLAVIEAVPALKARYEMQDRLQRGYMLQTYRSYPWGNLLRDLFPRDLDLLAEKLKDAQERRLQPSPVPWR